MRYIRRLIEPKLRAYFESFPCVLVVGGRQVGKSTLLKELYGTNARHFVFDPVQDLYGEKSDPELFLRNNPPPLILDEIQYVPGLVPVIKRYVDENRRPGLFLITGSQQWEVMRHLSESLAGRVAIIELSGFSLGESTQDPARTWFPSWLDSWLEDSSAAMQRLLHSTSAGAPPVDLIWRGAFPEVQSFDEAVVPGWMQGYVATYLQRDIRGMLNVRDETQFASLLQLCASLTAQECNFSQLGREIGLSPPTAQKWLAALRATFQWIEIPAWSRNPTKRLSQKPKGYLCDTGLASYLLRLPSPAALLGHPMLGALFETFVVTELQRQMQSMRLLPALHHFRKHSGVEVDLIVEYGGRLFPVEVKTAATVTPAAARGIHAFLGDAGHEAGGGLVVFAGNKPARLSESCVAVPYDLILAPDPGTLTNSRAKQEA